MDGLEVINFVTNELRVVLNFIWETARQNSVLRLLEEALSVGEIGLHILVAGLLSEFGCVVARWLRVMVQLIGGVIGNFLLTHPEVALRQTQLLCLNGLSVRAVSSVQRLVD